MACMRPIVEVVVDGEQQPPPRTVSRNVRTAGSPPALGSAGYGIDTRTNEGAGNGVRRASPRIESTAGPASSDASRARRRATAEMSIAVTVQPRRASEIASAPSPHRRRAPGPG